MQMIDIYRQIDISMCSGNLPTNNISSGGLARESSHGVLLHLITSGLGILLNWPYNTKRWSLIYEKITEEEFDPSRYKPRRLNERMRYSYCFLKHVSIYRWHSMTDLIAYYSGNIAFSSQEIVFNLFETLLFQF